MTVRELRKILMDVEEQDAEVFIMESQYTWESVLGYCPDPSNPDEVREIQV